MKQSRFGAPVRLSGAGLLLSLVAPTAFAAIEEIIVTAQKRTESVQDVPISVSAFDAQALDAQQIDGFGDLQFNVPNVSFSKGNFTGSNFQIRGIGTLLTATSGDSGVAMHVNDVYLQSPRLFETEYYDMEQVEILRGPQGTLFGRNSTGGAVNLKTAKPVIGEWLYGGEAQVGNFAHGRIKGAVNIPLGETMALRVAGLYLDRDGYTDNLLTGNDVDGREQWSGRVSFRWEATDRTTIDVMGSYFDEDSSRTRSQKQLCDQDPSGVLGCLPTTLQTDTLNGISTLGQIFASNLAFSGFGPSAAALALFDVTASPIEGNPEDLRAISARFDPEYEADESLLTVTVDHDLNDWLTVTGIAAYQETQVSSRMDYNGTNPGTDRVTVPTGFCAPGGGYEGACSFYGLSDGDPLWISEVPDAGTALGGIAGNVLPDEFGAARDLSLADSQQWSTEVRFTTNLDGRWNFLLAGYYLDFETETDYVVQASGLDYANVFYGTTVANILGLIDPATQFASSGTPFFNSETDRYGLESTAIFGEAYFDVSDTVKITLGLRWSQDEKSLRDRQLPLLAINDNLGANFGTALTVTDAATGQASYFAAPVPGSGVPVGNLAELLSAAAGAGQYDGDPSTAPSETFRDDAQTFDAVTGRLVVDWAPDLAFTDDTLIYASYSRGFKSGGLNPPVDAAIFGATPATFGNEEINAFEIGTKNTLMNGTLQANANVFFYDYGGLQIGKIVNRTSLNENTDADIFGIEGEFVYAPDENWVFNATFAYLDTELGDTETVDPRDPAQGRDDVTVVKDTSLANNCAVAFGSNPSLTEAVLAGTIPAAGYVPTGVPLPPFGGASLATTPGVSDSAFGSCNAIAAALGFAPGPDTAAGGEAPGFPGYVYYPSGVPTNLAGNSLVNAPELTVSLGGQYTHYFDNGMSLTGRVDYYWQDEFYSTQFNRPQDLIDAWSIVNAQVTLSGRNDKWYVRVFGQNLADDDNIVGTYATDPSSGLFTNAFLVEPRLYGATVGLRM